VTLSPEDLSRRHWRVLRSLATGPMNFRGLANQLGSGNRLKGTVLQPLEADGLVKVIRARNETFYHLTKRGRALLPDARLFFEDRGELERRGGFMLRHRDDGTVSEIYWLNPSTQRIERLK
jgi:DNA-binding MarR family transcriptional regulator